MKTINKEKLVRFVLNNDFAYVYGAGFMAANDCESRKPIAGIISQDGIMVEEVDNIKEEGCGCVELTGEKNNGSRILKVWNYNEEPLYIAYY